VYFHPFLHIAISSVLSSIQKRNPIRLTNRRKFDVVVGMDSGSLVDNRACGGPRGEEPDCATGIFIAEDIKRFARLYELCGSEVVLACSPIGDISEGEARLVLRAFREKRRVGDGVSPGSEASSFAGNNAAYSGIHA
jgi:hypothetical protein